jgi:hypothetical protein
MSDEQIRVAFTIVACNIAVFAGMHALVASMATEVTAQLMQDLASENDQ